MLVIAFVSFLAGLSFIIYGHIQMDMCQYPVNVTILDVFVHPIAKCDTIILVKADKHLILRNIGCKDAKQNNTFIGCHKYASNYVEFTAPNKPNISYIFSFCITTLGYMLASPFIYILMQIFSSMCFSCCEEALVRTLS